MSPVHNWKKLLNEEIWKKHILLQNLMKDAATSKIISIFLLL